MHQRALQIAARERYTQWLSAYPWDLFVTLTAPDLSHPESMYKRTRYLFNCMNVKLYGKKWWKRTDGIEHVIVLERQERGSVHSHALVRFPDHDINDRSQISLMYWQKFATDLGGFSWLQRPYNSEATTNYVCKYVLKDGEIYLSESFNPNNPRCYSQTIEGAAKLLDTAKSRTDTLGSPFRGAHEQEYRQ
jgi:hypothetical protein